MRTVPGVLNPSDAPTRPWPLECEDFDHWQSLARECHTHEVWEYTGEEETLKLDTDIVHYMNIRSNKGHEQTQMTNKPNIANDQEATITTNPEFFSGAVLANDVFPRLSRHVVRYWLVHTVKGLVEMHAMYFR